MKTALAMMATRANTLGLPAFAFGEGNIATEPALFQRGAGRFSRGPGKTITVAFLGCSLMLGTVVRDYLGP